MPGVLRERRDLDTEAHVPTGKTTRRLRETPCENRRIEVMCASTNPETPDCWEITRSEEEARTDPFLKVSVDT